MGDHWVVGEVGEVGESSICMSCALLIFWERRRKREGPREMDVIGGVSGMVEECTIKVCPISAVKILVMR